LTRNELQEGRAITLPWCCYGASALLPPPLRRYRVSAPSPPPARGYAAGRNDQQEDEAENGFMRGMVNTFTALTNQVIRISGGSDRNQGWPYFDGTFKEYPEEGRNVPG
jgi:hypothetical protein